MNTQKDARELAREIGEPNAEIETGFGGNVTKIGHATVTSYFCGRPFELKDYAAGVKYDIQYGFGGARRVTKRNVVGTVGTVGDINRRRKNRGLCPI